VLSNPCVTSASSSLMIYESLGAVWLSNPSVPSHSSSFMIFDTLVVVWDVESIHHP